MGKHGSKRQQAYRVWRKRLGEKRAYLAFSTLHAEDAIGFIADESGHPREHIAEQTRKGGLFVDDAQTEWLVELAS